MNQSEQKSLIAEKEMHYKRIQQIYKRGLAIGAGIGIASAGATGLVLRRLIPAFSKKLSTSVKAMTFTGVASASAIIKSEQDVHSYVGKLFEQNAVSMENIPNFESISTKPFLYRWKYPIVGSFATFVGITSWRKCQMKGMSRDQIFYNARLITQGATVALLFGIVFYNRFYAANKELKK
jgi:hypothetical protein